MKLPNKRLDLLAVVLLLLCFVVAGRAQWVGVDPNYPAGLGPNGGVQCLAVQPDGRLLVGGYFTNFNGAARRYLARLNKDGAIDPTFTPKPNDFVSEIVLQPDGRLLLLGSFTQVDVIAYQGFCRLRADGTPDTNFVPAKAQGSGSVGSVAPGLDGTVWVGGTFTNLAGLRCNHVARLLGNGSVDPTFQSPFGKNDSASVIAAQPDGKVVVSGLFTNVGGALVTNLARLNIDGSVDSTFRSGLPATERVGKAMLLPDGRLLADAGASAGYGVTERRLVRLNADGSIDPAFQVKFESPFYVWNPSLAELELQPDGKILVAGTFLRVNGQPRGRIARLLPDGSVDPCFDVALSSELGLLTLASDPEGGVIVGGSFSGLQGQVHRNLLRLLPASASEPGVIQMMVPTLLSSRGEPSVVVPVASQGGVDTEQTVEFSTRDGSAMAGVDYEAVSGTLIFRRGEKCQSIRVPLLRGNQDSARSFEVILRQSSNGASLGTLTNVVITLTNAPSGSAGVPDTNYAVRLDGPVQAILPLPGGKALIAGAFTNVNGQFCPNLARLEADGTRDSSFARAKAFDGEVRAVALDAAGRALAAGYFAHVDGVWRPGLARFLADGTLDPTFRPFDDWPTNAYGSVWMDAVAVLTDGSIVCAGDVPEGSYDYRGSLLKFLPNGTLDLAFASNTAPFDFNITGLKALPNGGFLEIGSGLGASVVALNSNGTVNLGFIPPADLRFGFRASVKLLPDGRMVFGAYVSTYSLLDLPPVWRLGADGVVDTSFSAALTSGCSMDVEALSVSEDGKVVAAGYCVDTNTDLDFYAVQRFYADGSLDGSFDCGTGVIPMNAGAVYLNALEPLSTGGWLLGGQFAGYNGFMQSHLVKILPEISGRPQAVSFTVTNLSFPKTNLTFDLEIRRRGDAQEDLNVTVFTKDGTGKAGLDYVPIDTNLAFGAGEWSKTISVKIIDNRLADGDKTFTVSLTNAIGGHGIASPATVTVSMSENDAGVEFISDEFRGRVEDGYVTVGVRWYGRFSSATLARFNVVPVTGRAEDLGISSATISAHSTNWFRIPIVDTARHEPTRQFRLELVGSGNVVLGSRAAATLLIDDANFATTPARGVAGVVQALANARQGGVYLAGDFMGVHGVSRRNVARLRADGEVDASFAPGEGPNAQVTAIAEQQDGKVIIAGDFTAVGPVPRVGVARLNEDGSVDPTFDPGLGAKVNSGSCSFQVVLPQRDGTVYLAGRFSQFNNYLSPGVVCLQSDGSIDNRFASPFTLDSVTKYRIPISDTNRIVLRPNSGAVPIDAMPIFPYPYPDPNFVYGMAVQPNGKLIVVGTLQVTGTNWLQTVQNTLLRLNQNGRVDATFADAHFAAESVALAESGKILVGGVANSSYTNSWAPIYRLQTNGTADPQFRVRNVPLVSFAQSEVRQVLPEVDGRVLFAATIFRDVSQTPYLALDRVIIARLLADGQWDNTFEPLTCVAPSIQQTFYRVYSGARDYPYLGSQPLVSAADLAVQSDGVLVLGGAFDSIDGEPRRRLARVDSDGSLRGMPMLRLSSSMPMKLHLPAEVEFPYVVETSANLVDWSEWLINDYPWWPVDLSLSPNEPARFFRARPMQ